MELYFSVARDALVRHGGTVEKFIGDAVMAVFGIPVLHEDDALRAVRAAAELITAVADLNPELHRLCGVTLQVRIGINTGEVVATDGRDGQRFVTGDAVNLAARMQQAAAPGDVVIGELTYALVRKAIRADPAAALVVKGKLAPVQSYRLLDLVEKRAADGSGGPRTFVGREAELHALQAAYDRVTNRRSCQQLTVFRPAGAGKSRLIAAFLAGIAPQAIVLTGRCLAYGSGITFWPVREMLHTAAGWTGQESAQEARDRLADLMPGEPDGDAIADRIAGLLGLTAATGAIDETFWAVRRLFELLARWRPLVLVLEDIHWSEPALLNLVDHVVDYAKAPILIVCSSRPELLDLQSGRQLRGETVELGPLSDDEVELVVLDVLGGVSLDPRVCSRVLRVVEGNPLFSGAQVQRGHHGLC